MSEDYLECRGCGSVDEFSFGRCSYCGTHDERSVLFRLKGKAYCASDVTPDELAELQKSVYFYAMKVGYERRKT